MKITEFNIPSISEEERSKAEGKTYMKSVDAVKNSRPHELCIKDWSTACTFCALYWDCPYLGVDRKYLPAP